MTKNADLRKIHNDKNLTFNPITAELYQLPKRENCGVIVFNDKLYVILEGEKFTTVFRIRDDNGLLRRMKRPPKEILKMVLDGNWKEISVSACGVRKALASTLKQEPAIRAVV